MPEYKHIQVTIEGGVAGLALNRPPLNILNIAMMREINAALDSLSKSGDYRVLAVSGKGKAFSAGVDVGEHMGDSVRDMIGEFHGIFRRLDAIEAPTVALVHGSALGGGCELAIGCDLLFAADGAKIAQPEVQVGVFPPVAAALLPRRAGWQAAADIVLTGRTIVGREAVGLGIAARSFADAEFAAESDKALKSMASMSGAVLRSAKKALRAGSKAALYSLDEIEKIYLDELMRTEDATEGLKAFLEKRRPSWKDR